MSFLFLSENIQYEPSLEPSQRDSSNEGFKSLFPCKIYPLIALSLLLTWTTVTFFNPISLRKAKIVYNFGLPECNRVKDIHYAELALIDFSA